MRAKCIQLQQKAIAALEHLTQQEELFLRNFLIKSKEVYANTILEITKVRSLNINLKQVIQDLADVRDLSGETIFKYSSLISQANDINLTPLVERYGNRNLAIEPANIPNETSVDSISERPNIVAECTCDSLSEINTEEMPRLAAACTAEGDCYSCLCGLSLNMF